MFLLHPQRPSMAPESPNTTCCCRAVSLQLSRCSRRYSSMAASHVPWQSLHCFSNCVECTTRCMRAETNYAPTEGKSLALVRATRKFRQVLHGTPFTLRTDHSALQWLSNKRFKNSKLERWAMRLRIFKHKVEYLRGAENVLADHMSRHNAVQQAMMAHLLDDTSVAVAGCLAYAMAGKALNGRRNGVCSVGAPHCAGAVIRWQRRP